MWLVCRNRRRRHIAVFGPKRSVSDDGLVMLFVISVTRFADLRFQKMSELLQSTYTVLSSNVHWEKLWEIDRGRHVYGHGWRITPSKAIGHGRISQFGSPTPGFTIYHHHLALFSPLFPSTSANFRYFAHFLIAPIPYGLCLGARHGYIASVPTLPKADIAIGPICSRISLHQRWDGYEPT